MRVGGLVLVKNGLLDNLGSLLDLLLDGGSGGGLLGHAVGLDLGVGLLGGGDLVAAVVADEFGKSLNGAGTGVLNGLVLGTGLEELDCGEARDVIGNVVGGGVNLGDGDLVGEGRVLLGQLIVLGGKGLAVSAPRGVELNENVLLVVDDEVLVALGDDHSGTGLLLLGDGLALDAGLDLAGDEVVNERADSLLADVLGSTLLGVGELLVLGDVLDGERGPGADLEVQVAGVLAESGSVDGSEVDLSAVLLGDGLEVSGESLTLLGGLGEDVGEGKAGLRESLAGVGNGCSNDAITYGHVAGVGLGTDLTDQGSGSGLGELGDGLGGEAVLEGALALVELLVENNGGLLDALGLGQSLVGSGAKEERVSELLSDGVESSVARLVVGSEVANEDDLVGGLELLERVAALEQRNRREGLLGHVGDNGSGLARALVGLDVVDAAEQLKGRVSLHAVALAQLLLLGAVDLCKGNVLVLQLGSGLLVLGGEGLAVTAPGCEDFGKVSIVIDKLDCEATYTQPERGRSP